jgi:hypothetical protein
MTGNLNAIVTLHAPEASQMANAGGLLVLTIGVASTASIGLINDLQRLPSLQIHRVPCCWL